MRKFRIKNFKVDNFEIKTFAPNKVFVSNFLLNLSFDILVKTGDYVEEGQVLMQKNNQKIFSPISGKVLGVKLDKDIKNELVYYIEIENDFKRKQVFFEKPKLENKDDLINICENFGLISCYDFASNLVKKTKKTLIVNAYDLPFVFNNKTIITNHESCIKEVLSLISKKCGYKKILFCCNRQDKNMYKSIFKNEKSFLNTQKLVIISLQNKNGLTLFDLLNISNALSGKCQTETLVSVFGGSIKNSGVLKIKFGTKICDIISFLGGFKQNIEEIEDFKYMSMVAFNDEMKLKQKIKASKNLIDKQKLEKMLEEKQHEAYNNIFSKIDEYHTKYLNCLSACLLDSKKSRMFTKNFDLSLSLNNFGLYFLSFSEFN